MKYDLIIKNGDVFTVGMTSKADIGIKDGRILTIADSIEGESVECIDVTGKTVVPGGVEIHQTLSLLSSSAKNSISCIDIRFF